jgi:hypothetical protein
MVGLQKGMTQSISHFSRNSDAKVTKGVDGCYVYAGDNLKSAAEKLNGFYRIIIYFLIALGIAIFIVSNFLKAV